MAMSPPPASSRSGSTKRNGGSGSSTKRDGAANRTCDRHSPGRGRPGGIVAEYKGRRDATEAPRQHHIVACRIHPSPYVSGHGGDEQTSGRQGPSDRNQERASRPRLGRRARAELSGERPAGSSQERRKGAAAARANSLRCHDGPDEKRGLASRFEFWRSF